MYYTNVLNNNMAKYNPEQLDLLFGALADSTRRSILDMLARGPASVNELAAPFDMSLPAISRHLKVLEKAGLISRSRDAQWRPCQLNMIGLESVSAWMNHYSHLWS
jgi:DNA-binding transcriptional ArsR family regulator